MQLNVFQPNRGLGGPATSLNFARPQPQPQPTSSSGTAGQNQNFIGPMPRPTQSIAPVRTPTQTTGKQMGTSTPKAPEKAKAPTRKSVLSQAEEDYQKRLQREIEKSYKSGISQIERDIAGVQARQPQLEQQLTAGFEARVPAIQQERESALGEARRQYEMGLQRGQAIFGGVGGTSAGQAIQDIASQELIKQQANIGMQTQNALNQLNLEKNNALTKLRDDFRREIDAINRQRFELSSQKSNAQLQALQDFASRRRNLEDFYTQREANIEDQLTLMREQARLSPVTTGGKSSILASFGFDDTTRKQAINNFIALGDAYLARQNLRKALYNDREVLQDTETGEVFDIETGANLTIY